MRKIIPIASALFSIFPIHGLVSAPNNLQHLNLTSQLKGHRFLLKLQIFESRDTTSSSSDSISNPGDYIVFSQSGIAYINYKNQLDSIDFKMIAQDSLSFGDTPFRIIKQSLNTYYLYQNQEEINGDYNRTTYVLIASDINS